MALTQEQRRIIKSIAKKSGVKSIRVFGSMARGENDAASDIDLLFMPPKHFTLIDHSRLQRELQEALALPVDLVSERALRPRYRERVLNEAKPL